MDVKMKVVALAVLLAAIGSSNGMTPGFPSTICNIPNEGLMACRPAVTQPNPPPPSVACCSALSQADMSCLCSYRNSALLPSLGIDPDLAMDLPIKCKLSNLPPC